MSRSLDMEGTGNHHEFQLLLSYSPFGSSVLFEDSWVNMETLIHRKLTCKRWNFFEEKSLMLFLTGKKSEEKICLRTSCHPFLGVQVSIFQSPQLATTNPLPCYLQKKTKLPLCQSPFNKKNMCLCHLSSFIHGMFPPCFLYMFSSQKTKDKTHL